MGPEVAGSTVKFAAYIINPIPLEDIGDITEHHIPHPQMDFMDPPLVHVLKWHIREEENVLFNDTLNTFYLRLYGITHMVKDHSDSKRANPLWHMGYSF